MDPLTFEQQGWVRQQMSRWLRVRSQHEGGRRLRHILESSWSDADVKAQQLLIQIAADVDHSALLSRLLSGKEPLDQPPSLDHAYPVYPD